MDKKNKKKNRLTFSVAFHPTSGVDTVSKKAISGHRDTDDSRDYRSRVQSNSDTYSLIRKMGNSEAFYGAEKVHRHFCYFLKRRLEKEKGRGLKPWHVGYHYGGGDQKHKDSHRQLFPPKMRGDNLRKT